MQPERPIFREQALQRYMQKKEKEVVPHLLSPAIFTGLWMLFCLFLLATLLVLRQQVPRIISSSGIVLNQHHAHMKVSDDMVILAFLPATRIRQFHVGQQAIIWSRPDKPGFTGTIQHIESSELSPADIQRRYIQDPHIMLNIAQSSFVAEVRPARPSLLTSNYERSGVTIQVNVGSQSVLSLLPGIGAALGD